MLGRQIELARSDVIGAAAFCPHPPVLVPEMAQAAATELDELRAACREAITRCAAGGRPLLLLGAGPTSQAHAPGARGSLRGYGVALEVALGRSVAVATIELPLSLTVGAWLVRDVLGADTEAIAFSVGPDWRDGWDARLVRATAEREVALVVMGDGSARRSTAAPGYLDPRAEQFDARVARALGLGDSSRLDHAWLVDGPELMAAGAQVWEVAARALEGRTWRAELLYNAAPYGVGYFAAAWTAT